MAICILHKIEIEDICPECIAKAHELNLTNFGKPDHWVCPKCGLKIYDMLYLVGHVKSCKEKDA